MRSSEEKYKSDCFTMTEGGELVYLLKHEKKPTQERFVSLVRELSYRAKHNYKVLIWTPYTHPNPDKFKWSGSGGGYQGLQ